MTTRAYKRYRVENFPELAIGEEFATNHQPSLALAGGPQSEKHNVITLLGFSEHMPYYKYHVWHEIDVTGLWRYNNDKIQHLIEIVEMNIYKCPDSDLVYFKGTRHSRNFLQRLADSSTLNFSAYEREIDLGELTKKLGAKIKGAQFANLEIENVTTAAIYGDGVADSHDYERYTNRGDISFVIIELDLSVTKMSIRLSRDGTILLYKNQNEREDLTTLVQIDEYIEPFILKPDDILVTR